MADKHAAAYHGNNTHHCEHCEQQEAPCEDE